MLCQTFGLRNERYLVIEGSSNSVALSTGRNGLSTKILPDHQQKDVDMLEIITSSLDIDKLNLHLEETM